MICCNEEMEVIDYKFGQYKCQCKKCGGVIYHQPFSEE
jgi:uncharacterized Zn finger protein